MRRCPREPTAAFVSITRTKDELSIVCREGSIPDQIAAERGWRCLQVEGHDDRESVGVLAALTRTSTDAGVSLFVISTWESDYLLVKEIDLDTAPEALILGGHSIVDQFR